MAESSKRTYVLASRASKLAQIQTNAVRDALEAAFPDKTFATSFMTTEGDKNQSQALYLLGGKALWTKELEVALKDNLVDIIVHCAKDMPTGLPDGCELGAILEREDPADSLVVKEGLPYKRLEDLPDGSVIGTSSVRRVAQLRKSFPKLAFMDVRGNLVTRLAKLDAKDGPYAALILAKAGMVRSGLGDRITLDFKPPTLYYAVGQGSLAVEIRTGDDEMRALCGGLLHQESQWKVLAERAMLRKLEGGCSVPVGTYTELSDIVRGEDGKIAHASLKMSGTITSIDGTQHVEEKVLAKISNTSEAERVGAQLAERLITSGGGPILLAITEDRARRTGETKTVAEGQKIEATMEGQTA
ncbi:porphobilinogen deaminase [Coniophora puteana RWD-64-598 SS2]|uniref:hydroxymethylbilane synthase n=1 Tax=Coniophora puteana (strain RWD-64-598) TaxID=741705 RepID=A0A5M3N4I1_CONPW|nr:porphobilinogen deaminase [Coniophora puteana RWD-64-598 SS2]EIW86330.1 porphobilinogen deaminase [Coniophora puteana RWD-64-598 SS2]